MKSKISAIIFSDIYFKKKPAVQKAAQYVLFTPHNHHHCAFSLHLYLPSPLHPMPSTSCLIPSLSSLIPLSLSFFSSLCLILSRPRRRRGLIIIKPGQATPGDMASNERKIHPALSLSSLSLSASIYPSPQPSPNFFFFLIRQIPRELGAISAAGTGVMCVSVCLRDLGAYVYVPGCVCVYTRVCVC